MPGAGGRKRPKRNRGGRDFKEEIAEQAQNGSIEVNLAYLEDQELNELVDFLNRPLTGVTTIRIGYNPRASRGFNSWTPGLLDIDSQRDAMQHMRSRFTPRSRVGICRALANVLNKSAVQELEIGVDVTQQGLVALGEALMESKSVTKLSLAGSLIGDGIEGLKAGLMENTSLTHLDVSRCDVGNSGARSIAGTIKAHGNEHMRQFWKATLREYPGTGLSGELIADDSTPHEAKIVGHNAAHCGGLVRLNLSQNKIGFQGAVALRDALGIDWRMVHLDLSQNLLTGDSLVEFSDLMKDNHVIQEINLLGNVGIDDILTKAGKESHGAAAQGKASVLVDLDMEPHEPAQHSDLGGDMTGVRVDTTIDPAKKEAKMDDMQTDHSIGTLVQREQKQDPLRPSPKSDEALLEPVKPTISKLKCDSQQRSLKRPAHHSATVGGREGVPSDQPTAKAPKSWRPEKFSCGRPLHRKTKKTTRKKAVRRKAKTGEQLDESMDLDFTGIIDSLTQVAEHLESMSSPRWPAAIATQQGPRQDEKPGANMSPRRKFNFQIPELRRNP